MSANKINIYLRIKKLVIIVFLMICSPVTAWELGEESKSYACFRESSKSPVKVTIEKFGDILITWDQYPVTYNFITLSGNKLISGGIWLSVENDYQDKLKNMENIVLGYPLNTNFIEPVMAIFNFKTRKLTYGIIGQSGFQMGCVVL